MSALPHIRALLITLHLVAITLAALPAPVGMKKKDLTDPLVVEGLAPVHTAASTLGYDGSPEDFALVLYELGRDFLDVRKAVLEPFGPYYTYAGTRQSWRMFGAVNDKPARVELYLDSGEGEFEPLYIAREPEHDWRAAQLDQERFRAVLNDASWRREKHDWERFTTWAARQAAADFPEATRLRAQVRYRPIPRPEVLRELEDRPNGKIFWRVHLDLAELRRAEDSGGTQ